MQVRIEDVSPVEKKMFVEIPWETVSQKLGDHYRELSKGVALKGFRKDVTIDVFNLQGGVVLRYHVFRCWISEYQALPELADVPTFHELLREHGFQAVTYRDIGEAKNTTAPSSSTSPLMRKGFATLSIRPTTTTPQTARSSAA